MNFLPYFLRHYYVGFYTTWHCLRCDDTIPRPFGKVYPPSGFCWPRPKYMWKRDPVTGLLR